MSERKPPKYDKFELERELRQLDEELVSLLARRAGIVDKLKPKVAIQARRKKWQNLERELWSLWEHAAQENRSDVRSWRKIFSLAQELTAESMPDGADRAYVLSPRKEPVRMDCSGPPCTMTARLWAVLAAQAKAPLHVRNKLSNDPLVELLKALNQAGASLYWDELGVHSRGKGLASFGEGVVFAGDDCLNLLLLMALCLGRAGSARFSGGGELKQENLAPLRGFLPTLGARMAFVHPGSNSVPLKLEASGVLPESIWLPTDMPAPLAAKTALALCMASPSYANGLSLEWGASHEEFVAPLVAKAVSLLRQCGLQAELETGACRVQPGELTLPKNPELPLDPYLSAALLALPVFAGGSATLRGPWPEDLPQWRGAAGLLRSAGLELVIEQGMVSSTMSEKGARQELELGMALDLLPLAVAIAAKLATTSGRPARLRLPLAGEHELAPSVELISMLGLELVWDADIYTIRQSPEEVEGGDAFVAPDARWGPAVALASFSKPGLKLANPGVMSGLMPGFWRFFNSLPDPGREIVILRRQEAKKEDDDGKKSTRRRIRT